ncbi:MAG: MFS transporter [Chloroflexi bacterium]|nr:MFS transporter [Chloroflexota bacterium]
MFSLSRLQGGLIAPFSGILIDRWGPRRLMMAGIALMGIGFILLSRVHSLLMFYVIYTLFVAVGLGFGPTQSAITAVGNWFVRRRSTAMGIVMAGFGMGGAVVSLLAWFISNYGWRNTMLGAGILILVVQMPLALLMRHRPEQYGQLPDGDGPLQARAAEPPRQARGLLSRVSSDVSLEPRQVLHTPAFWLLATIFSIRQMITNSVSVHTIPFLEDLGFSPEMAAGILGIIAVTSILGRIFFGWLGDHMDQRVVNGMTLGLLCVAMLVMSRATGLTEVLLYVPIYAMAYGGSVPQVPATLAEYFGRKHFGAVQGFSNTVQMVGNIGGPLFAGYVFDVTGSYRFAFVSFSVAAAVATLMLFAVRRPRPQETPAATIPAQADAKG